MGIGFGWPRSNVFLQFAPHMSNKLMASFVLFLLQLKELKQELGALRVAKVTGGAPNKLSKM